MNENIANILREPLEDVMHECFLPYAEYVILERALPRVEDGLKPVQRRILYSMYDLRITPEGKTKKCARIVGETMGKYHPHGDSSIYDALARMAQDFSMSVPLIDGQGNFGSIDGDGPAAMRYTEARLAPPAMEMLADIDKQTVPFQLNFDDTLMEPMLLPAKLPNLLINGATGIAVGLATNIPPHNPAEAIDGVILRMKNSNCTLKRLMSVIKAPDFPTGGELLGMDELEKAYETGKGKITLRAKTEIETKKNGKTVIAITELPYEVRESAMLRKIHSLRETKKNMFAGIDDVRSETDRFGVRAVVELKKGADPKVILDCLYKYSDLQITYGINMVAIAEGQPKQLGLLELIDYYIEHRRTVVANRLRYEIEQLQEREHKLAGLMIAVSNIDKVIAIIRSSKNSREAKARLMEEVFYCDMIAELDTLGEAEQTLSLGENRYKLTGAQAQAILDLRLARLTQLEILDLKKEYQTVVALLKKYMGILASPEKLDELIISELRETKKKMNVPRRTQLSEESAELNIDMDVFKIVEECAVVLTRGGAIKRMSIKNMSKGEEAAFENAPAQILRTDTSSKIRVLTDKGGMFTLPVQNIKEGKPKDAGASLASMTAGVQKDERIINILPADESKLLIVTSDGKAKIIEGEAAQGRKTRSEYCILEENARIVLAEQLSEGLNTLAFVTRRGMSLRMKTEELPVQGRRTRGVAGVKLGEGDEIVSACQTSDEGRLIVFTEMGYAKMSSMSEYTVQARGGKGIKTLEWAKNGSNGKEVIAAFYIEGSAQFRLLSASGQAFDVSTSDIPVELRAARGKKAAPAVQLDKIVSVFKI